MPKFVKLEGVAFNTGWMKTKTLKEFIDHEKHHGIPPEKMKEFYESVTKPAAEKPANEK
jgi:hypothetical protein